jgi:hypothetical protein
MRMVSLLEETNGVEISVRVLFFGYKKGEDAHFMCSERKNSLYVGQHIY